MAVKSTVGQVKAALVKAGAERGIVAPITYINHEDGEISKVLRSKENILRPYLLKSVTFDYEEEIRFVLGAQREIMRDKGGLLILVDAASFIEEVRLSPHLQKEEQSIVKTIVEDLRNRGIKAREADSRKYLWDYYSPQNTFTKQDSLPDVFSDLTAPPAGSGSTPR